MARIELRPFAETEDVVVGSTPRSESSAKLSDEELLCSVRRYHLGTDAQPQLSEITVPPGVTLPSHAHATDEIIYVTHGELHLGRQVLPAGSSVYIPGDTLYSLRAGPEGLRFLNFRPHRDSTYYTKEEVVARKRSGPS